MARRIEVELTSKVDEGTWTWRAAGAKQPKGTLDAKLLYDGAKVGDVVRAEAEIDIDGIVISAILPPKAKREEAPHIELLPTVDRPAPAPTPSTDRTKPPRRDRPARADGPRPEGARPPRQGAQRGSGRERTPAARDGAPRRGRGQAPAARPRIDPTPERPKPKRLSPGHTWRKAVLDLLPPEQRPIAEHVLRGGIPAVRQALETQNAALVAEGQSSINPEPLLALAEELLPALKTAEWRDRAEAALEAGDELGLRDLRSVVTGADLARDDDTRTLARTLRESLDRRLKTERDTWLADITQALEDGRVVRALRIASRPPDASLRFPAELGARLAEHAGAALGADAPADRWLAVLDAVTVSPVRRAVRPAGLPKEPSESLLATARNAVGRVPNLGPLLGIETAAPSPPPRPGRPSGSPIPPPPRPPRPPSGLPQRPPPGAAAPMVEAQPPEPGDVAAPGDVATS